MLSSFKICSAFCDSATHWQPKRYKNKGKLQEKITLKNHAICVKSPCILHEITACFDADSNAISVKTQCKMIEMRASKLWNGFAQVQKLRFHFYLVAPRSVKKGDKSLQGKSTFPPLLLLILRHNKLQTIGFCSWFQPTLQSFSIKIVEWA